MRKLLYILLICVCHLSYAKTRVVNVYGWSGEVPRALIHQFEEETGIHVNFSTYDNNEILYAKLHASKYPVYDVIIPSSYFVERLKNQQFLTKLDKTLLPNLKNLDRRFSNSAYDPSNEYSIPLVWGVTGIFYNKEWVQTPPQNWSDLWQKAWKNRLMLLDDPREVFGMALITLGYNPNDDDPLHISQAFERLKNLGSNIKLFASESIQATIIDEDVHVGVAWNGDAYKARLENPNIEFIYPDEGFTIWIDCLAIVKNAPHLAEAYEFLDFMMRAQSGEVITLSEGYTTANAASKARLPKDLRENPMVFPSEEILERGFVQRDIPNNSLRLYNYYWQKLKFLL